MSAIKQDGGPLTDPWAGLDGHRYDAPRNREHALRNVSVERKGGRVIVRWECVCGSSGDYSAIGWAGAAEAFIYLLGVALSEE